MNQTEFQEFFLSTPLPNYHRHVGKQWFVYDDGFWVVDEGEVRINRAIQGCVEQVGWITGGMVYMRDRVRRELRYRLHADRLPAHWDPFTTPEGQPSGLQAPEAELGLAHGWEPGLPVADLPQEQVDQADTASRDDHTP